MKKRIVATFIGIFIAIISIDISLGVLGYFYKGSYRANSTKLSSDTYKILCLGNSYTFGGGAPPGQSYPDHLQRIFDAKINNHRVKVINKGINNFNSANLLHKLEELIKEHRADFIILRSGSENSNNFHNYSHYLKREKRGVKWFYYVNDFLYNLRSYRLITLLLDRLDKSKTQSYSEQDKKYAYSVGLFYDKYESLLTNEKLSKLSRDRAQEEIKFIKSYIEEKQDPIAYYWLGRWYKEYFYDYTSAAKAFIKGIELAPYYWNNLNYTALVQLYQMTQDPMIDQAISRLKEKYPNQDYRFSDLKDQEISSWVQSDVLEMIRIIRKKNIPFILQNYPTTPPPRCEKRPVNQYLRQVAQTSKASFLDVENAFIKTFEKTGQKDKYFAKVFGGYEGHPNSRGYKLNADLLFPLILKKVSLKQLTK